MDWVSLPSPLPQRVASIQKTIAAKKEPLVTSPAYCSYAGTSTLYCRKRFRTPAPVPRRSSRQYVHVIAAGPTAVQPAITTCIAGCTGKRRRHENDG